MRKYTKVISLLLVILLMLTLACGTNGLHETQEPSVDGQNETQPSVVDETPDPQAPPDNGDDGDSEDDGDSGDDYSHTDDLPEIPKPGFGTGFPIQGGVILHAFCWSFNTIAENMADIAAAGFTAVQTSPITESITDSPWSPRPSGMQLWGDGAWWFHYQPVSYRIGNYQLGTEEEFIEMCRIAREHDIKVIVDVVANHFTSELHKIRDEVLEIEGGAVRMEDSTGRGRIQQTQGRLLGLYDVITENPNMQQAVLEYLKRCVELGASGFRYDAALHIELPDDPEHIRSDFWPVVLDNGAEFQYGEVLDAGWGTNYARHMPVTDAAYGNMIVGAARTGRLRASLLTNHRVNAPASQLVTWVESHDTFCNEGVTADLTPQQIVYGWAVIASRSDSTPLFLSRPAGSSPGLATRWGDNIIGERGNDHFMSREITALNWFKRAMHGSEEYLSNPIEEVFTLMMIQRGNNGVVIINTGEEIKLDSVDAELLEDGEYIDVISGNKFVVSGGKISGTVYAESVVVIY